MLGLSMPILPLALLITAQDASPYPNAGTFAAIGVIAAVIRRRSEIGGWLFFFMWQLFVGFAVSLFQIVRDWHPYTPAAWSQPALYLLYILSIAPRLAAFFAAAAACFMLLRTFDWHWVTLLRSALMVYLACGVASIAIDHRYFPEDLTVGYASLIFPVVLLVYTRESQRFRRVFKTHDWRPGVALRLSQ